MPPVLPSSNEEGLDGDCPPLACKRRNIDVAQPSRMDRLTALNIGQRAQQIAVDCSELEIAPISSSAMDRERRAWNARIFDRPAKNSFASPTSSS